VKFGPVKVGAALGSVAAHSVRLTEGVLRKGAVIGLADIAALQAAGIDEVVVARLEAGDLDENSAAARLAQALAGRGLTIEAAFTGRVNLFAREAGIFTAQVPAVDAFNAVDEAITLATLPSHRAVVAGEMVATVKIIPYGLPEASAGLPRHAAARCRALSRDADRCRVDAAAGAEDERRRQDADDFAGAAAIAARHHRRA
jgi:molybdenum cofactor cytidylyltransferase